MMSPLPGITRQTRSESGFTLIEMSIVLVIIGLIVGGVLVGQNLISAAAGRAQISQIEKYNQAVNTFVGKYGAKPGDMKQADVTRFGFTAAPTRAGGQGRGDGNNLIEGYDYSAFAIDVCQGGETLWFWEDLSANAGLIDGTFSTATDAAFGSTITDPTLYLPQAKINKYMNVYVYANNGYNYYGLSAFGQIAASNVLSSSPILSVAQAYAIDKKMDDGLPTTGNVLAQYVSSVSYVVTLAPNAATPSSTTCYDTTSLSYSITQNGGTGLNCALSFQFQ